MSKLWFRSREFLNGLCLLLNTYVNEEVGSKFQVVVGFRTREIRDRAEVLLLGLLAANQIPEKVILS